MTDPVPAYAAAPLPPAPKTTDPPTIVLPAAVAGFLLVLLIANVIGGVGFPSNAPVEQIMALGVSVDLLLVAIALVVRAAVVAKRPRAPYAGPRQPGPFGILGAVFAVVCLVATILMGVVPAIDAAVHGADLRYMSLSAGMFYPGLLWGPGVFFAVAGHRPGRGALSAAVSYVALAVLMLVAVFAVVSALAYGAGLTE